MSAIRKIGFKGANKLECLAFSATREEFDEFLQKGVDENGVKITKKWIDDYDALTLAKKPLAELHKEVNNKEVILYIHPQTQRVVRRSHTVRIILINPITGLELVEFGHFYVYNYQLKGTTKTATYKRSDRTFSFSETIIMGETWLRTVIRCLRQEGGIKKLSDLIRRKGCSRIEPILDIDGKIKRQEYFHESKAYPGFLSNQEIRAWCYVFSTLFDENNRPPWQNDNGKYTLYEWRKPYSKVLIKYIRYLLHKWGRDNL